MLTFFVVVSVSLKSFGTDGVTSSFISHWDKWPKVPSCPEFPGNHPPRARTGSGVCAGIVVQALAACNRTPTTVLPPHDKRIGPPRPAVLTVL